MTAATTSAETCRFGITHKATDSGLLRPCSYFFLCWFAASTYKRKTSTTLPLAVQDLFPFLATVTGFVVPES